MPRPITLFTGQWADLPLVELAAKAAEWGYDGLELACWGDHVKDARRRLDGRRGILGSHLDFGSSDRGWDFVSPGRGDVDFESMIRALNRIGYQGPLSVEWEDAGMDREAGAREAVEFVRTIDFPPAASGFDEAFKR